MTRLEIQELIESRLGQRTGIGPRIVAEIKMAQLELERKMFLPWFLRAAQAVSTSFFIIPMPLSFIREIEDESLVTRMTSEGKSQALDKHAYSFLVNNPEMTGVGTPKFYATVFDSNSAFERAELFPRPDTIYTFNLAYYKAEVTLSDDNTQNGWSYYAPKLLVAQAGLQISKALRSPEAVSLFASDLLEATKDLRYSHTAREVAATSMTMGG